MLILSTSPSFCRSEMQFSLWKIGHQLSHMSSRKRSKLTFHHIPLLNSVSKFCKSDTGFGFLVPENLIGNQRKLQKSHPSSTNRLTMYLQTYKNTYIQTYFCAQDPLYSRGNNPCATCVFSSASKTLTRGFLGSENSNLQSDLSKSEVFSLFRRPLHLTAAR